MKKRMIESILITAEGINTHEYSEKAISRFVGKIDLYNDAFDKNVANYIIQHGIITMIKIDDTVYKWDKQFGFEH